MDDKFCPVQIIMIKKKSIYILFTIYKQNGTQYATVHLIKPLTCEDFY